MTGDTDIDRDAAQLAIFEASRARLFSLAYRILGVRADAEAYVIVDGQFGKDARRLKGPPHPHRDPPPDEPAPAG